MAVEIDFEGMGIDKEKSSTQQENNGTENKDDVTNLDGNDVDDVTSKDGTDTEQKEASESTKDTDNPSTGELNVGDSLEVDGNVYTVAENGDLVDKDGTVFKEAKNVKEWLNSVEVETETDSDSLNISAIQEALGVTITDDNGTPVEFSNDAAGIKSYVSSVIDLKSNELKEAAINRLYSDNPLLKQFQDYVQLTGSPKGFGDIPDRSKVHIEKDNELQHIAIIRMAAKEFGNHSLNDNYIKYLKDSGGLYDEAKTQLAALIDKDNNVRKDIEEKAEEQRRQAAEAQETYWNNVRNVINNRTIGNFKIPESFTKEVNGKKMTYTPNDFFDYLSKPSVTNDSGNIMTGYQASLANLSDEEYLNRELVDAWLMFTGGTYKDLIDMAVKEEKVRQLKIKAKEQRTTKAVKIIKKSTTKSSIDDIIL